MEQLLTPAGQLKTIIQDFEEVGIDYCVLGGLALAIYNYDRATDDIDILVSRDSVSKIDKFLIGNGYTRRPGSTKDLYFHVCGRRIPIDILVEGDDKSGFVMPNPQKVRNRFFNVWYVDLPHLIAFKLNADEPRHVQDVLSLIKANELKKSFAKKLPPETKKMFLKYFLMT